MNINSNIIKYNNSKYIHYIFIFNLGIISFLSSYYLVLLWLLTKIKVTEEDLRYSVVICASVDAWKK